MLSALLIAKNSHSFCGNNPSFHSADKTQKRPTTKTGTGAITQSRTANKIHISRKLTVCGDARAPVDGDLLLPSALAFGVSLP
jgi:hypothetical protein